MPIGNIQLNVKDSNEVGPIGLRAINKLEEGQQIDYAPLLKAREKRPGKVMLVLVPASAELRKEETLVALDPKPADKPAHWTVPFRVSLAAFVYGPEGLDKGKVKRFLSKDDELLSQLADYAEKTAQTEALLQALAALPEQETAGANLNATLQGFAGQYGFSNKIDRTQPADQQMVSAFSALNPAFSTYDPIAPSASQKIGQTASVATAVAAMFFGTPVGLAAGGTAMAMNLKMVLFPNSEFRSAFAQQHGPAEGDLSMCGKRDPPHGRTRVAYVWALKIPDSNAPPVAIRGQNHLAEGLKTAVKVAVPDAEAKLIDRGHAWQLVSADGKAATVGVHGVPEQHAIDIDLTKVKDLKPGRYDLHALWDWNRFDIKGALYVDPLSDFENARLTPDTHDLLLAHDGKLIVSLEGADFEFVEKVALTRDGDKYNKPVDVPFSLPLGPRDGHLDRLEMQVDTQPLDPGQYSLLLVQQGGSTQHVGVQVLAAPPRVSSIPVFVNQSEAEQTVTLHGEHLDKVQRLDAAGVKFTLGRPSHDGGSLTATVVLPHDVQLGQALDLRVYAAGFANPIIYSGGLKVSGPRPRIVESKLALPADLEVSLKRHELPAGVFISSMLSVRGAGANPAVRLECEGPDAREITVSAGDSNAAARVQSVNADTLFLSFDPGAFPTGCQVTATVDGGDQGRSDAYRLGRVVRIPRIESFKLTDESAGDGQYFGVLTGDDLEMIEKTGWDADRGVSVGTLPTPIAGEAQKQSLKVKLAWPSPTPHAPLYVWLHGDSQGRATTVRY